MQWFRVFFGLILTGQSLVAGPKFLTDPIEEVKQGVLEVLGAKPDVCQAACQQEGVDSEKRRVLLEAPVRMTLPGGRYLVSKEKVYGLLGVDAYGLRQRRGQGSHGALCFEGFYFKDIQGLADVHPLKERGVYTFMGLLLGRADFIAPSLAFALDVPFLVANDERAHNRRQTAGSLKELVKNPNR